MSMMIILTGLFLLTSFLFFLYILRVLFLSDKRMEKRVRHYLATTDSKRLDKKIVNTFIQLQLYNQRIRQQMLSKKSSKKLDRMLQRAGIPLKPEEYVMFQWISTAFFAGFLFLISNKIFFLILGLVLGYMFPNWYVKRKEKQRIQKFNDGLADMITTMIGSLRAGFSFPQSLKTVAEEADSPIKEEIETVIKEMQYGSTLDDSLYSLKERMPSEDLDLMIQAVVIQKQVGGNLATILDTIVNTIRERVRIQRQIQTLTAQGRLSGIVIGLLPIALGIVLYLIEPDYISTLFTTTIGQIMLGLGIVFGIIGLFTIRKITTIEV